MGKKLTAVFTQTVLRGDKQEMTRKVLTFEQKEGQWKIVRERNTSTSNLSGKPAATLKTSDKARPESADSPGKNKQQVKKQVRVSSVDSVGVQ